MKLTKAQAKKYCLIKWGYARKTGCTHNQLLNYLMKNHMEVWDFINACAYCEKYICNKCPLHKLWGTECIGDTPYNDWCIADERGDKKDRLKYAEQIYQDIKRS